jgi:FKBP-type peptidyl-prolyl cis-trans isomerase FkpA
MQDTFYRKAAVALGAFALVTTPACAQAPASGSAPAPATPALAPAATVSAAKPVAAPAQLTIIERKLGEGPAAAANEPVLVHYTGYLYDASAPAKKGAKFDSSVERAAPLGFIIGAGRVIKGWDEGVTGMKVGGQRTLIIPPDKAYGDKGAGALIPPNSTLVFDVELMGILGKTKEPSAKASEYVPGKDEAKK